MNCLDRRGDRALMKPVRRDDRISTLPVATEYPIGLLSTGRDEI
jgi:hypothetical protein